jgi:excisionase family DNA binding protein
LGQAMLTPNQTCELLNIDRSTFYRLINKDPGFPAYKIGGVWRIDTTELEDWKHNQKARATAKDQGPTVIKKRLGRPPLSGTRPIGK